jgi:hypothetical protein
MDDIEKMRKELNEKYAKQLREMNEGLANRTVRHFQEAVIGLKRLMIMWGDIDLADWKEKILDGNVAESDFDVARSFTIMLQILEVDMEMFIDAYGGDNEEQT